MRTSFDVRGSTLASLLRFLRQLNTYRELLLLPRALLSSRRNISQVVEYKNQEGRRDLRRGLVTSKLHILASYKAPLSPDVIVEHITLSIAILVLSTTMSRCESETMTFRVVAYTKMIQADRI